MRNNTAPDRNAFSAQITRRKPKPVSDFVALRISLASPEDILSWSYGEVTKPETINYRTLKPERDGLFDERIFGPTKDWECACGKYKKIRYKGIICDKCGVEVTRSSVRRERMGHINLVAPVSHIWYLRGTPSRLGLTLNIPARKLEQVIYFAAYIITAVDEEARQQALVQLENEYKLRLKQLQTELKEARAKAGNEAALKEYQAKLDKTKIAYQAASKEISELVPSRILSEAEYRDLTLKYGQVFKAGIGAEALYEVARGLDLEAEIKAIKSELTKSLGQKRRRLQKRLRLFEGFKKGSMRPEWMFVTMLPVIPPDLRPMVQLDGGRFATSDLNDLYRRVINRNNRLKKLIELGAPEVICRNEKRMLQEAVDALFDISARETSTSAATRRRLKSLSDMLRGKQGRFRQNLLGKRVDYSGRSVIVVGPDLNINECGLPKLIALELFRPFVISKLLKKEIVHNVKTASKLVERQSPEVWDALDEVIGNYYVLLNRAPTLHRLSIQAFKPVLVEGNAIQIHPLVCPAFNADFDGDQMAVHLPLSKAAQEEAEYIMLSSRNLLKPATGDPIAVPSQDMVLGCYYLTLEIDDRKGKKFYFANLDEALIARHHGIISYHTPINIKHGNNRLKTTLGRLIFNQVLPPELGFYNKVIAKGDLKQIINSSHQILGSQATAKLLDRFKALGFRYSTLSGLTISAGDLKAPPGKPELIKDAEGRADQVRSQYKEGLITEEERHRLITTLWGEVKEKVEDILRKEKEILNPVDIMVDSRARGDIEQVNQLVGIVGLKVNPTGRTIELPVKSNYKEGLSALEYFIATHGARKGGADTALKTSDAGYLTRRLVDVAQDTVVVEEDCGAKKGIAITRSSSQVIGEKFSTRLIGRVALKDIKLGHKLLVRAGELISAEAAEAIENGKLDEVWVRSVVECRAQGGVCRKCYGNDLARGSKSLVELGTAVGIVAAQSIGEPGTQLTMRTFHTGGVASSLDITRGLPRVEELFEARTPKTEAILAEGDGEVKIFTSGSRKTLRLITELPQEKTVRLPKEAKLKVKDGERIKKGSILYLTVRGRESLSPLNAKVEFSGGQFLKLRYKKKEVYEYPLASNVYLKVKDGQRVKKGQELTEGYLNVQSLFRLKGLEAARTYIMEEVQKIYSLQGQDINDRHVEVILRQMFSKVRIKDGGSSSLIPGDIIDYLKFLEINNELSQKSKKPLVGERLLLGVSKAALKTEGFLSAASFQETTRVLVEAAVEGKIDSLKGLKENVIIGRLIPAGTGFWERQGKKNLFGNSSKEGKGKVDEE